MTTTPASTQMTLPELSDLLYKHFAGISQEPHTSSLNAVLGVFRQNRHHPYPENEMEMLIMEAITRYREKVRTSGVRSLRNALPEIDNLIAGMAHHCTMKARPYGMVYMDGGDPKAKMTTAPKWSGPSPIPEPETLVHPTQPYPRWKGRQQEMVLLKGLYVHGYAVEHGYVYLVCEATKLAKGTSLNAGRIVYVAGVDLPKAASATAPGPIETCPPDCKHVTFHYCAENGTHCDKHCACSCRLCRDERK
jgi:hypothetical protein